MTKIAKLCMMAITMFYSCFCLCAITNAETKRYPHLNLLNTKPSHKKAPQHKEEFKRVINDKNEHRLVLVYTLTIDWVAVKESMKRYSGYFDDQLDHKEIRVISIAVPVDNSEDLRISLQTCPGVISVEYDTVVKYL